jgi:hypothetical protein
MVALLAAAIAAGFSERGRAETCLTTFRNECNTGDCASRRYTTAHSILGNGASSSRNNHGVKEIETGRDQPPLQRSAAATHLA